MDPRSLASLMAELEVSDPHDLADLAIDEREARALMANHLCEIDRRLGDSGLDPEARLEMMAAIAAHAMVENFVLHLRSLESAQGEDDFRDWMRRHGLK